MKTWLIAAAYRWGLRATILTTAAIITLKQIVVNAPSELRDQLQDLADQALLDRCASFRVTTIDTPLASARHTLRALARRWRALSAEIAGHDRILMGLTTEAAPTLCAQNSAVPARLRHPPA